MKRKKKSTKKDTGVRVNWVKLVLILFAALLIGFFAFMQSVRSGLFGELPSEDDFKEIRHEQATLILGYDGSTIGKIFAEDRTNVKFEDLPQHLINALVATEDARFFSHEGVDGRSYVRVFFRTLLGRDRSGGGGSTISQQIIKNLYGRGKHGILTTPVNKMKEALVAQRLERMLTKNEVLVLYFNSVPFGENVYGVEAAAHRYFSKPTNRLNVQESAVLVGMLKANTTYNPRLNPKNSKGRRDQVLGLMQGRNYITSTAADSLKKLPITLRYSGVDSFDRYGYFNAKVQQEANVILDAIEEKSGTKYDLKKDGLRITTTLDPALQLSAYRAVHEHLSTMQPKLDRELRGSKARKYWEQRQNKKPSKKWKANAQLITEIYEHDQRVVDTLSYRDSLWHYRTLLNGAVLMMDPSNGAVRAWVGGNDHRYLPYDLVQARHPIASTIKPVIYAAALERGMLPCTYLDNEKKTYAEFEDWAPDNFDRDTIGGEVALWYALAKSMNRPTVDLYFRTGADTVRQTMKSLGIPYGEAAKPAVALGATNVSLTEIVPAYGAFAMKGRRVSPQLISRITDAKGKVIYEAKPSRSSVAVSEATAASITTMLQRAVDQGTGTALRSRYGIIGPFAGKTGTSQNYSDAWFVTYTPGLVVGAWVGAFEPDVHFQGANGTGGHLALPIVGLVLKDIERAPDLRKRYIRSFDWLANTEVDLDCDARRSGTAIERFFEDLFKPNKEQVEVDPQPDHTKPADYTKIEEEVKKDPGFFDRLFKKKE
ncbi:MAG: transglycosylase domain-containing protein [Flavobacteriales bacterium]|nr:transglycosylase domain-containing protein [Flavobacteriales bacterium]